jgi:flagella basal body P-ring formation protein FlgA
MRHLLLLLLLSVPALAAEPVSITLLAKPGGTEGVVTIGQAAKLTGGSAAVRERMAKLDLVERDDTESISRKLVRFRLRLAGFAEADFTFADAAGVPNGTLLTPEVVEEAARQELFRRLGTTPAEAYVDVVKPIVVKLPTTTATDVVELSAVPVGGTAKFGRSQVDVTIKVNGERKLTLPVFLQASLAVVPAKAEKPSDEVVIKAKARVTITAKIGDLKVTAGGLAVENGKVGQSIRVENLDSKKVVTGVVTGPGAVEIDLGESK